LQQRYHQLQEQFSELMRELDQRGGERRTGQDRRSPEHERMTQGVEG
jgi:hypothetical protein